MAQEEYKEFICSSIGMACGFQVRAKTDAEIMAHAKMHAAEAHGIEKMPAEMEKKIKGSIKSVSVDIPKM
jgi:predicted small metal-binding protein